MGSSGRARSPARAPRRKPPRPPRGARRALRARADQAYGQVELAGAAIALAQESVGLSREDLRVSQERYRLGLATILDLQAAQITLRQAEVDVIQRRFDYALGIAEIEALLGETLP